MIMVGAGTGMAPFRGFLQERESLRARGVPIARSLLFLGCRDPEDDLLYADELAAYEKAGVATLFPAYSRVPGSPYRYVQHALEGAADEVWAAMQDDAVVYVCGNASTMAPGVRAALVAVFRAKTGAGEVRRRGLARGPAGVEPLPRGHLGRDRGGVGAGCQGIARRAPSAASSGSMVPFAPIRARPRCPSRSRSAAGCAAPRRGRRRRP